jgi:hypothetical protein
MGKISTNRKTDTFEYKKKKYSDCHRRRYYYRS